LAGLLAELPLGCQKSVGPACNQLGMLQLSGKCVARNVAEAVQHLDRACGLGDAAGCNNLGNLYLSGEGVRQDLAQAKTLLEKACDGGSGVGCQRLGRLYEQGLGVARDARRAAALRERACHEKDPIVCDPPSPPGAGRHDGLTIVAREPAHPPSGPPTVIVKEPTVGPSASLQDVTITRVFLQTARDPLRGCYERALRVAPTLAGVLLVRFIIGTSGAVRNPEVVRGLAAELDACVIAQVSKSLFPIPSGGEVTVTYPFTFRPDR